MVRFISEAGASGTTPELLAIVADQGLPEVVRQRAFGRIPLPSATSNADADTRLSPQGSMR